MNKYKASIITAIIIMAALAGAWLLGGTPDVNMPPVAVLPDFNADLATVQSSAPFIEIDLPLGSTNISYEPAALPFEPDLPEETLSPMEQPNSFDQTEDVIANINSPAATELPTDALTEKEESGSAPEQGVQILGAQHPNMRGPAEPESVNPGDESFTVTLSVRVDMILYNMHLLNREKHELVPPDGIIFPATEVTAYAGESVFNLLQREMRRAGIHMSSRFTPVFNSAYVEAINNLYEFDAGALSGWMYRVNGWFPNFGASRYLLNPGDQIEWLYTVDLGRDLGVDWLTGGQEE